MEPTFSQTRCRLAVLRKPHNTTQDLVCGDSLKNHVQPGGAQQIETCWISINFSVERNFTGQIIASVMTYAFPTQIVRSRKGRRASMYLLCQCSDCTQAVLVRAAELQCMLARGIKNMTFSSLLLDYAELWYREVFHLACMHTPEAWFFQKLSSNTLCMWTGNNGKSHF